MHNATPWKDCKTLRSSPTCKSSSFSSRQSFHRPRCYPWYCRQTFHWPTALGKESKAGVDGQERGGLSSPHWPLHSGDTVALCQASRALLILQREVRERLCTGHVSPFSLVSLYIMYKEYSDRRCAPSVGASHARFCAKEVKHRLDEFWEIVVVLPAPVLPCVGVVEVHWPTVSWEETDKRDIEFNLKTKHAGFDLQPVSVSDKVIKTNNRSVFANSLLTLKWDYATFERRKNTIFHLEMKSIIHEK